MTFVKNLCEMFFHFFLKKTIHVLPITTFELFFTTFNKKEKSLSYE